VNREDPKLSPQAILLECLSRNDIKVFSKDFFLNQGVDGKVRIERKRRRGGRRRSEYEGKRG
jgi:hypothetical protein